MLRGEVHFALYCDGSGTALASWQQSGPLLPGEILFEQLIVHRLLRGGLLISRSPTPHADNSNTSYSPCPLRRSSANWNYRPTTNTATIHSFPLLPPYSVVIHRFYDCNRNRSGTIWNLSERFWQRLPERLIL